MTPEELLALLEQVHHLTAQGILGLRERLDNQDKYTAEALAALDAQMAVNVGQAQLLADQVPDYRVYAVVTPDASIAEGES